MNTMTNPKWLNTKEYPFKPNFFKTSVGNMHYVDEGKGEPIIFIHGNPSWSYEFRNMIKKLSKTHRCIAPDHIGFGLSDKPVDWTYLPKDHAKNLETLFESLNLENITLFVGDWGGPIGLSYAINHPNKLNNLVITNTWLWSVKNDWYYKLFSKLGGGSVGRWLINWYYQSFSKYAGGSVGKWSFGSSFGDRNKLTSEIYKHYIKPFDNPKTRKGCWVFPKEIIGSSDWLQSLWDQHYVLKDKNILIAWGMKDTSFREKDLNQWIKSFPEAKVVRYEDAGHFVAEEKPNELIKEIKKFF